MNNKTKDWQTEGEWIPIYMGFSKIFELLFSAITVNFFRCSFEEKSRNDTGVFWWILQTFWEHSFHKTPLDECFYFLSCKIKWRAWIMVFTTSSSVGFFSQCTHFPFVWKVWETLWIYKRNENIGVRRKLGREIKTKIWLHRKHWTSSMPGQNIRNKVKKSSKIR